MKEKKSFLCYLFPFGNKNNNDIIVIISSIIGSK